MADNLKGGALLTASMAAFAVEDAIIKGLTATYPPALILAIIGASGFVFFGFLAALQGANPLSSQALRGAMGLRNLLEAIGTFSFVLALAMTTLTTTSAILQAAPLLVTMGAALFYGEQVGWRRWSAIAIGFIGVLLILRPGLEGFRSAALWAVVGVVALAGRDLVTRRVSPRLSNLQMAGWGFAALLPAAVMQQFLGLPAPVPPRLPDAAETLRLVAAFAFSALGYYALTVALRIADLSAIAPLRYSRMLFALILAVAVLGEQPDMPTLAGAALVILSGLYTLDRERRIARRRRTTEAARTGAQASPLP